MFYIHLQKGSLKIYYNFLNKITIIVINICIKLLQAAPHILGDSRKCSSRIGGGRFIVIENKISRFFFFFPIYRHHGKNFRNAFPHPCPTGLYNPGTYKKEFVQKPISIISYCTCRYFIFHTFSRYICIK